MHRPLTIVLGAVAVVAWVRRGGVRHVIVTGSSMSPTLRAGDRLLLVASPGRPRPGQLALANDPRSPERALLKRVHAVVPGGIDLRGDDPAASTDSRTFGHVPHGAVRTYLAWRYAPAGRAGRVPAVRVTAQASRWREELAPRPVTGSRALGGRPRSR